MGVLFLWFFTSFTFISFCYSLFCGSVSFCFFFSFLSFSLNIFSFFFSILSLFILFYLGGSFVLVQVKQLMGFYRVFIMKIGGRGVCTTGNVIMKKDEINNKCKRANWVHNITQQVQ